MAWRRRAVTAGYKNVALLKKDFDLRRPPDFQQLLAGLAPAGRWAPEPSLSQIFALFFPFPLSPGLMNVLRRRREGSAKIHPICPPSHALHLISPQPTG